MTQDGPSADPVPVDEIEIARLAAADSRSWWIRGRRALIAEALGRHARGIPVALVADLGCGAGGMWEILKDYGPVVGVDRALLSMSLCKARGYAGLARSVVEAVPLASASLDLALMTDVLEHVRDDEQAIRECARVLRPGGVLLLTVAALPLLYGAHDRALGHFRRYSRRQLAALVQRNGFTIERLTYFNTVLAPVIAVVRLLRGVLWNGLPRADPLDLPGCLNALAYAGMTMERRILRFASLPFGLSLLCVARKVPLQPGRAEGV